MFSCTPVDPNAEPVPPAGCGCCAPQVRAIARRIDRELSRRGFVAGVGASLAAIGFAPRARAQGAEAARPIVFSNFLLFDGKSSGLQRRAPSARRGRPHQDAGDGDNPAARRRAQ